MREQGAEPQRLELDRDLRLLQPLRQLARQRRHRVVVPVLGDRRQRQDGAFRIQRGYDHSYFFVASFIPDHVSFHADALFG